MKYEITIEESISQTFIVEADNKESAMSIAEKRYYAGEFVLDAAECSHKQMCIHDMKNDSWSEWVEF